MMHEAFLSEIRALLGSETDAFLAEMDRVCEHSLRLNPFREDAAGAVQVDANRPSRAAAQTRASSVLIFMGAIIPKARIIAIALFGRK